MTAAEFRRSIALLRMSQQDAGIFFGYSPRQGQRWAADEYPVPRAVAMLLHVMIRYRLKPKWLEKWTAEP